MMIQHNLMALNSHRQLGVNNSQVRERLEMLSSGYRINRAADDAAGLAISERMRAQITGLDRAVKNALDGSSLVQTAEGAMGEMHGMLNRMVELATQSANGTYGGDERQKIESELDALKEEIDRISQATNFNGIKLLDGSLDKEWQPVTYVSPSGTVTPATRTDAASIATINVGTTGGTLDDVPELFRTQGTGPISVAPSALAPSAPPYWNALVFSIENRNSPGQFLTYTMDDIEGRISRASGAAYTLDLSPFGSLAINNAAVPTAQIPSQPRVIIQGVASYLNGFNPQLKVDATEVSRTQMELVDIEGLVLQVGDTADPYNKVAVKIPSMNAEGLGILSVSFLTQAAAAKSIDKVKEAIDVVSANRGNMGALQNRLDHTIQNLEVSVENMTAAESRIRDADMAKEYMHLTKDQILTQSAQSMLAQANTRPQQVLQLLQ